ncbi:MAG: class I SAM-dependent DNA methyltransferase, partial [Firmicutes bacterium]|nr:class I SAM-dependent DNA methyltransferase [Bacillota bacterium]
QVERKRTSYRALTESPAYKQAKLVADAWCAAFVWPKTKDATLPITNATYEAMIKNPDWVSSKVREEIEGLTELYRFFHWHIAFPDVFRLADSWGKPDNPKTGWSGGFDVVLANPPWERVKIQEKEWFAGRYPEIAEARTAAIRADMIKDLKHTDPWTYKQFREALRQADGESHFIRKSGRYPLCGRGDINRYSIFAEIMRDIISPAGRVGAVIPSGIATDDTTKLFFQDIMGASDSAVLVSFHDFENRRRNRECRRMNRRKVEKWFPDVDARQKFSLVTMAGPKRAPLGGADFVFFATEVEDLTDPDRHVQLTKEDIELLNPNTLTVPIFRSGRDAELTKRIYQRVPVLIKETKGEESEDNRWELSFVRLFDMTNDSELFRGWAQLEDEGWSLEGNVFTKDGKRYLPLYEAKMIHHFDHRWATYLRDGKTIREMTSEEKGDPTKYALPRYWVPEEEVETRLKGRWDKQWLMGWRDITNTTNERTLISAVLPRVGVGNKFPLIVPAEPNLTMAMCLIANLSSISLDYVARQKLGGTSMNYFIIRQLPVLPPSHYAQATPWAPAERLADWISQRVIELLCTANDLKLTGDDVGGPERIFTWNDERRFLLRCELDAAFFHLYGLDRADAEYILDTFPIVKRNDENAYGEYRTKQVVLSIYDQMAEVMTGLEESALGVD